MFGNFRFGETGWRRATIAVLTAIAIPYWYIAVSKLLISTTAFDFRTYYEVAKTIRFGGDPYLHVTTISTHDPPAFELCFVALTLFPIRQAFFLWNVIDVAALALSCWLLARRTREPFLFLLLTLLFAPVINNFDLGQSKIEILCLLVLAMYWIEQECDCLAGAALALASLWRIFPILMLGYLAVRHKYRTLMWAVGWLAAGTLLTVKFVGWTQCVNFLIGLQSFDHQGLLLNQNNLCMRAVILRNTGSHILALAAVAVILGLTIGASFGKERDGRIFALWVATAVMILPLSWTYDMVILLIPFASLASAPAPPSALALLWLSYFTASAQTWLYLFGVLLLGARLTSFLYPISVHGQWIAPLGGYFAALLFARDSREAIGSG